MTLVHKLAAAYSQSPLEVETWPLSACLRLISRVDKDFFEEMETRILLAGGKPAEERPRFPHQQEPQPPTPVPTPSPVTPGQAAVAPSRPAPPAAPPRHRDLSNETLAAIAVRAEQVEWVEGSLEDLR